MKHHTKTITGTYSGRQLFAQFLKGYALNGLGFLIPRRAFEQAGLFDESMRYLQDLDLWLRIMWYDFRFICHSDLLCRSRVHLAQQTNTISHLFDVDRARLAEKHSSLLKTTAVQERERLLELYLYFFVRGNNKPGIQPIIDELKTIKAYTLRKKCRCLRFRIIGSTKTILRKIRDRIFAILKLRN